MSASANREFTSLERTLSIAAVVISSFGVGVSFGVGFPLTALTLESWGEPKWVIGLAGSAPAIATVLVLPFAARLIERIGPVTAILFSSVLASASFLALGAVSSAWVWIAIRLIMSAGVALPWLVGETWINLVARDDARARAIAIYVVAFFAGFAVGPQALNYLGTTGLAPFIVGALGAAFAGIPILFAQRLAPEMTFDRQTNLASSLRLVPIAFAAAFIGGFSEITYLSLMPNVGLAAGLDEGQALRLLTIVTVGGLVLQFPLGWIADKWSRIGLLIALAIGFIVFSILLPFALGRSIAAEALAFLIGGIILGFYTIGLAMLGERVTVSQLAEANAAFIVMYQLGGIVGPIAAGTAMSYAPVAGFIVTLSGMMALSIVGLWLLHKSDPPQS